MKGFLYDIGQQCWYIESGYGKMLYQGTVLARLTEETSEGVRTLYRVGLKTNMNIVECVEECVFGNDQAYDALCKLESIL